MWVTIKIKKEVDLISIHASGYGADLILIFVPSGYA